MILIPAGLRFMLSIWWSQIEIALKGILEDKGAVFFLSQDVTAVAGV